MILREFTAKNTTKLGKLKAALAENYDFNMNLDGMTGTKAEAMANRARLKVEESGDINRRIKFAMIAESLELWMQANVQTELTAFNLAEGIDDESMEEAKVILAAKEISDKIQGMIEDAAKMQVQDLLPIVDAMKSETGQAEADAFASEADAALGQLVEDCKTAKSQYDNAILTAQGQSVAGDMDNFDMDGGMDDMGDEVDVDMDMDVDAELDMDPDMADMDIDDEFGGDAPAGREMKDEI